jgi:hypothetical protein
MAFGLGGSVTADTGALRGVQTLLNIVNLLSDPQREALAADLRAWAEARNGLEIARAEAVKAEQAVAHRERQAAKHEEVLQKREADLDQREQQVRAAAQHLEQQRAEFAELRAEVRKSLAA